MISSIETENVWSSSLPLTCFLTILPPPFFFCTMKRKHLIRAEIMSYIPATAHLQPHLSLLQKALAI